MADGGVAHFCSEDRAHRPGCEYFAGGGEALPEGFELEQPSEAAAPAAAADSAPPEGFEIEPDREAPEERPEQSELGQGLLSAAEGFTRNTIPGASWLESKGVLGPIVDMPGNEDITSLESQRARAEANPGAAMAGGTAAFALPIGTGASIIKNMMAAGLMQGNDEVSKWIMGDGDPQDPVGASLSHVGGTMLTTGLFGLAGKGVAKGVAKLAESKVGARLQSFLAGIGAASKYREGEREAIDKTVRELYSGSPSVPGEAHPLYPESVPEATPATEGIAGTFADYKAGQKAYDDGLGKGVDMLAGALAGTAAEHTVGKLIGSTPAYIAGNKLASAIAKPLGKIVSKVANPAAKVTIPTVMKMLGAGNTSELLGALGYAQNIAKGSNAVANGVEGLFGVVGRAVSKPTSVYGSDEAREKLHDWVSGGGSNQDVRDEIQSAPPATEQAFAEGGEVGGRKTPDTSLLERNKGIALHYPEHNILLNAARARAYSYLNGLRPQENQPKLAFADEPDTTQQKRAYHRALDIAHAPLGVLEEIKNGTLEPEHVAHLNALYPEVNGLLQKKITERITKAQLAGERPTYHIRQGLSVFMGTPMSGEFTPQSIQAAQAVFAAKQAPQPAGGQPKPKSKGNSSTLTKASAAYLTEGQAREQRQMKV